MLQQSSLDGKRTDTVSGMNSLGVIEPPVGDVSPWRVIVTYPQHEAQASRLLFEKGVEHYLPTCERRSRLKNRPSFRVPLFPRYLFAKFALVERAFVMRTPGLHSILSFSGIPALVSDEEIAMIREMVAAGAQPWKKPLQAGDEVDIHVGGADVRGVIVEDKGDFVFLVSFPMFGRTVKLDFHGDVLRRAA